MVLRRREGNPTGTKLPGVIPNTVMEDLYESRTHPTSLVIGEEELGTIPTVTDKDWEKINMTQGTNLTMILDYTITKYLKLGNQRIVKKLQKEKENNRINILVNPRLNLLKTYEWETVIKNKNNTKHISSLSIIHTELEKETNKDNLQYLHKLGDPSMIHDYYLSELPIKVGSINPLSDPTRFEFPTHSQRRLAITRYNLSQGWGNVFNMNHLPKPKTLKLPRYETQETKEDGTISIDSDHKSTIRPSTYVAIPSKLNMNALAETETDTITYELPKKKDLSQYKNTRYSQTANQTP